jgi:uncharacterized BrkB/YihY/UPF0761 family membrane protein
MAWRLFIKFDRDWGFNLARLLAFTLLMALFAIVGLQLVGLALFLRLSSAHIQQNVIVYTLHFLPDHVAASAVSTFARGLRTAPAYVLALGLPVAIWYGSRFFVVLESALCVIFRRPKRRFLAQNRAALLMLLLIVVLLPVIVFSATGTPRIGFSPASLSVSLVDPDAFGSPSWGPWLALLAGLLANFIVALAAYTWLTPGHVSLRAAWPGALVAATLSQGYLLIFPLYVRYVLYPNHFGAIAGFALVALVFFYAYGLFIVIGAEIAAMRAGCEPAAQDLTGILAHSAHSAHSARALSSPQVEAPARAPRAAMADEAPVAVPVPLRSAPLINIPASATAANDTPTDPWLTAARQ